MGRLPEKIGVVALPERSGTLEPTVSGCARTASSSP